MAARPTNAAAFTVSMGSTTPPATDLSNGILSSELSPANSTPPAPSQVGPLTPQSGGARPSGGSAGGSSRASGSTTPNGPNTRSPNSRPVAVPVSNAQRSVPAPQYAPLNAAAQQSALEAQQSSPSKPNGALAFDYLLDQTAELDGTVVLSGALDDPTSPPKPVAIDRRVGVVSQRAAASPNLKPQPASAYANASAAVSSAAADARVRELEALVSEREARIEELERTNQAQLSEFKYAAHALRS